MEAKSERGDTIYSQSKVTHANHLLVIYALSNAMRFSLNALYHIHPPN